MGSRNFSSAEGGAEDDTEQFMLFVDGRLLAVGVDDLAVLLQFVQVAEVDEADLAGGAHDVAGMCGGGGTGWIALT